MPIEKVSVDPYVEAARRLFSSPRADEAQTAVEFDASPEVSSGTAKGKWVQAWVWIPDAVAAVEARHQGKTDEN